MQTAQDLHALLSAADRDAGLFRPRAALATLTRTIGSTFRRPGSRMLIGGNGEVVRGLSGGCPEADIVTRAKDVIGSGRAQLVRYNRDYGLDALIELGCGGELEVLIEPVEARAGLAFLDGMARAMRERRSGFLATVVTENGATAAPTHVLRPDGAADRAGLAERLAAAAPELLRERSTAFAELSIDGRELGVLFEAIRPPVQLVVVGTNPVADALARQALGLRWSVTQIDPRGEPERCAPATAEVERRSAAPAALAEALAIDVGTYGVVMTYKLESDIDYAAALLRSPARYVGILGSRKRSRMIAGRLAELVDERAAIERLYSPAGLDIGSEDPEQIAVSVCAEITAIAAGKRGGMLSRSEGPIH